MKKVFTLMSAVLLSSCSTNQGVVAERTTIVENKVMVVAKCIDRLPPPPQLVPVPREGSSAQAIARIKREEQLVHYSNELVLLAKPCVKSRGDDNASQSKHHSHQRIQPPLLIDLRDSKVHNYVMPTTTEKADDTPSPQPNQA